MIDIKELRIGNWFIGYDNKPFIWGLEHFSILLLEKNAPDIDELIKSPIPLTEEILLKCGFEFKNNAYFSPVFNTAERIRIVGGNDNFHFIMNIHKAIKIKSLHQLQNLIFILTEGKELEYGHK